MGAGAGKGMRNRLKRNNEVKGEETAKGTKRELLCERSRGELKQLLERKVYKDDMEDKDISRDRKIIKGWRGRNKKNKYKEEG